MDYWKECISEALEDAGIKATDEQIENITGWVEGAHENYGMSHGYDAIPSPEQAEIKQLEKALAKEREKDHSKDERERADNWKHAARRAQWKVWELNEELNKQ